MLSERVLVEAWQHPQLRQWKLRTVAGQELRVVDPGTYSGHGPDFRGAVLLVEGRVVRGDVEVDLGSRSWQHHGHHRAPAFSEVVLQVVYRADSSPGPRPLSCPGAVLSLSAFFSWGELEGWTKKPCGRVTVKEIEAWGEDRFRGKAEAFGQQLAGQEADQVLFQGLLIALGYSANQRPMAQLAQGLRWRELTLMLKALSESQAQGWLACLFRERAQGLPWQLWGLRPQNHPWRRLEAASHLLARYQPELVAGLRRLLTGVKVMERGLTVPRLLGQGRAGEIAVNILLPFFWALGEARAWELFKAWPLLEENGVCRLMRQRLHIGGKVGSACAQQGLLHCYKVFCHQGRCGECSAQLEIGEEEMVPMVAGVKLP